MTYAIVLADDQPLMRQCVRDILADKADLEVVGEADDVRALLDLIRQKPIKPDMAIVDITMPERDGIEATRQIASLYPGVRVLILSAHREDEYLDEAMGAGASAYIVKKDAERDLLPAIRAVRRGRTYVSRSVAVNGI
jgi:DNA-binding NarL/FixJ family response regulator